MALETPSEQTLDEMFMALDYDPAGNQIVWIKGTLRRPPGWAAGTITKQNRVVIRFNGVNYPAGSIAWFLHSHGSEWPSCTVRFRNRNALDLRKDNLVLAPDTYSQNPKAVRARRYYQRDAERRRQLTRPRTPDDMSNVHLTLDGTAWNAYDYRNPRRIIGAFDSRASAEEYSRQFAEGVDFLAANPPPPYTPTPTITAGKGAITLADARDRFAYDPFSGRIWQRYPKAREGLPAITIHEGRPAVRTSGRSYPAGMFAWFLTHGVWPRRRQIGYRDRDPANLKLDNLYLKGHDE